MSEKDDFLAWVDTVLKDAEIALHNGDPAPRAAIWSRLEPVSVYGAWRTVTGQQEVHALFDKLGSAFSNCTSYAHEITAVDVVGDMAYTVGLEHIQVSVNGEPRTYVLRATQVYRREDGQWKVAHRHADNAPDDDSAL